jgi:16S rRNA (cytidine1402-2'-O)-methyltransferase
MGKLYLVATPIGNLEDISARALRILREAALIAAEDTRHTKILLKHYGIEAQLISYFEHNKIHKLDLILEKLSSGDVALVSDAGTPAINDPGYELIKSALASGFDVVPVPGPSALISALIASGLPTDSFTYLGYLPHKSGERRKALTQVAELPYTLIFLESPHRIVDALEDLRAQLGDRQICVAREMTKLYEEFWRGSISGAAAYFSSQQPRGEFTLVVAGRSKVESQMWAEEDLRAAIQKELEQQKSAKEISAQLAEVSGWNKKDVYALVNTMK